MSINEEVDHIELRAEVIRQLVLMDDGAMERFQLIYEMLPSYRSHVSDPEYNQLMKDKILLCYDKTLKYLRMQDTDSHVGVEK